MTLDDTRSSAAILPANRTGALPENHRGCLVTSWKKTGNDSVLLEKYINNAVSSENCTSYRRFDKVTQFCIGFDGEYSCKEKSGSPLSCLVNGQSVLFGLLSHRRHVNTRCTRKYPAVYVNVPHFLPWIQQHVHGKLLNISYALIYEFCVRQRKGVTQFYLEIRL